MSAIDIAKRVYDHTWKLDPIVRSLLDTDFYKLLMLQMIWGRYPDVQATFSLINRTKRVRIADEIDEKALRDQLDYARTLRLTKKEMIWLAGNTFYGRKQIFAPEFLEWLSHFQLPEYDLRREDGQYVLEFAGPWTHTTMWEIPGAGDHHRAALARGAARHGQIHARCRLRTRQGEAVEQGRAACARCPTCASPTSARGGATLSSGSAGASKR